MGSKFLIFEGKTRRKNRRQKNSKKKLEEKLEKTRRHKYFEEIMMPTEEFMVSEVLQYEENNEIQYEVQFVTDNTNNIEYFEIPAENQLILEDEEIILEP